MRPEFLFHGSIHRIEGALRPGRARDLAGTQQNMRLGVYATHKRAVAIAVALCKCVDGKAAVNLLHLNEAIPPAELWWGQVHEDRTIYLYTCPSDTFDYLRGQWVSPSPVVPVQCEELRSGDCLHLLRRVAPYEALLKITACHAARVWNHVARRLRAPSIVVNGS
jgi:hypothetical protein